VILNKAHLLPTFYTFVKIGDGFYRGLKDPTKINYTIITRLHFFKITANKFFLEVLFSNIVLSAYIPVKYILLIKSLNIDRLRFRKLISGSFKKELFTFKAVTFLKG
jgi:hypothetical protein